MLIVGITRSLAIGEVSISAISVGRAREYGLSSDLVPEGNASSRQNNTCIDRRPGDKQACGHHWRTRKAFHHSPNTNSARPAATAITCPPSIVNEIGGDFVDPPSDCLQTSRPLSASSAKRIPPDAPNTSPPPAASRPL